MLGTSRGVSPCIRIVGNGGGGNLYHGSLVDHASPVDGAGLGRRIRLNAAYEFGPLALCRGVH